MRRLGDERDTSAVTSREPRQAHLEGFDLHANVRVSAHDRAGVGRLRLRRDGRVALELKRAWHDGTRELVFEPLEFLGPKQTCLFAMMHRAFAVDVLACAHCGGRLRLITTLHDSAVIRKILAHRALAHSGQGPDPGPPESGAAAF